jgi:secondary thiamine-phosphate synthase enzyme
MICLHREIVIETRPRASHDVTQQVQEFVARSGVRDGLCTVFVRHTSASLVIQENADPSVQRDLRGWLADLAPESRRWAHDTEGADDMPAHARSAITRTSETIPVAAGRLALGTWQGLFLWEHRAQPHRRRLLLTVLGIPG